MSMMTSQEREKRLAVEADARYRTSIHEAGHAVVGQALGLAVDEVTVCDGPGGGVCHVELPPHDTLDNIKASRNRRTTDDLRSQVVALRERGMVPTAIADVLNLSDRRVRNLLNQARKASAVAKENATSAETR